MVADSQNCRLDVVLLVVIVLQVLCYLLLIYQYKSEPLLKMPADWFWPADFIISFPTRVPGKNLVCINLLQFCFDL